MKLLNQLCPSAVKRQGLSNLLCNFSFKKKSVPVTKNRRDMVESNLVPVGEAFCKHSITGMYSKHDESLRTLQSPPFFCHNWHPSTLTLFQITASDAHCSTLETNVKSVKFRSEMAKKLLLNGLIKKRQSP